MSQNGPYIIDSLKAPNWPQDENQVPFAGSGMPPVTRQNAMIAGRECFANTATFNIPLNTVSGQQFTTILPTDQDGDLWVEQIYATGWLNIGAGPIRAFLIPGFFSIQDIRNGKYLTWSGDGLNRVPAQFFQNIIRFQDAGFNPGDMPLPNGFRSTGTLIQPYCFTRQGGISVTFTSASNFLPATDTATVTIAFSGWKEYENASR